MKSYEVAIIGGGLAGVTAMDELLRSDPTLNVALFEAKSSLGGRMETIKLSNGDVLNLGAEFVDAEIHNPVMHELASRAGTHLVDVYDSPQQDGHTILYNYSHSYNEQDLFFAIQPLIKKLSVDALEINRDVVNLHSRSVADYLKEIELQGWSHNVIIDFMSAMYGVNGSILPASTLVDMGIQNVGKDGRYSLLRAGHGKFHIKGGSQGLVEAIAAPYNNRIEASSVLIAIKQQEIGYILTLENGRAVSSEKIILSAPLPALRHVDLTDSGLDSSIFESMHNARYGTNGKTIPYFETRPANISFGATHILSSQLDGQVWENAIGSNQGLGITIFHDGEAGHAINESSFDAAHLLALQHEVTGLQNRTPDKIFRKNWLNDPFAGGSYFAYSIDPTKLDLSPLHKPNQGIFFAGEHTNPSHTGFMESAAQSGIRVAKQMTEKE